jgi:geranylgeranyl pyrophosphate synthase
MVSIFRNGIGESEDGFSLISSVFDPESGANRTLTRVDRSSFEHLLTLMPQLKKMGLDDRLLEIYLGELHRNGPPRGIELADTGAQMKSEPFSVLWDGFSFSQAPAAFRLAFTEPGLPRECEIELRPEAARIAIPGCFDLGSGRQGLRYNCYPRLSLDGKVDGRQVTGRAWLDHQWGSLGFLMGGGGRPRSIGWDWFGINFDDGTDWVVGTLRNMKTRRLFRKSITIRERDGSTRILADFKIRPRRHWESTSTNIRYPVAWRIEVPELEARLDFEPLADGQEIPVLGLMRAIWEGAGTVSGSIAGREVRGAARGELQGYGYPFNGDELFGNIGGRVDRHLESFLPRTIGPSAVRRYVGSSSWQLDATAYTEMLSRPVWDLIRRGGKKWRPTLAILLLDALGIETTPYEELISALAELTHTGSLIIDDIEDSSLLRRGDQSIHLRYGQDVAINAANTIYFLPMLTLMDHRHLSEKQRLDIHEVIMRQFIRAHFGQALDLFWTRKTSRSELRRAPNDSAVNKILQMYEFKSAAIVEGLAETAAIIAGSDGETRSACTDFGRSFGVAFQIVDDVHNFSNGPEWRKECGEDLGAGKLTYVILRAARSLRGAARKRLWEILFSEELRRQAGPIEEGVDLIQGSGALEQCRTEAKALVDPAMKGLAGRLAVSESKISLLYLCHYLLDLDFNDSSGT